MKKIFILAALAAAMCSCTQTKQQSTELAQAIEEIKEEFESTIWSKTNDNVAFCYSPVYVSSDYTINNSCWYESVNVDGYDSYYAEMHWNNRTEVYWSVKDVNTKLYIFD